MFFDYARKTNVMKTFYFFASLVLSFNSLAEGISFQKIGFEEAQAAAIKNNKNFFVDVYIDGCAPCKYLTDKVFVNKELGDFMNENFISIQLNPSYPETRHLKTKYNISCYPTLLYFNSKGELIRKIEGSKEVDVLMAISMDVAFPELSVLYKMHKEYYSGKREKTFLRLYAKTLNDNDSSAVPLAREYVALHGLNLDDCEDLQMLLYAEYMNDNQYILSIFNKIDVYYSKEPVLIKKIVKNVIDNMIIDAANKKDFSLIEKFIPKLLPVYKVVIDPLITNEKLTKIMQNKYENRLVWGHVKFVQNPTVVKPSN